MSDSCDSYATYGHKNFKHRQYEEVGRNQIYLTEEEEIELVNRYKYTRSRLHWYILTKTVCKRWYLDLYLETRKEGKSVAKLSSDFNPRVKGLNAQIEENMIDKISLIDRGCGRGGFATLDALRTTSILYDLNPSEYCYSEMEKLMPKTKILAKMKDEIAEIEDTLLRSMLMAAHEIANRCSSNILSIDEGDAVQEVQIFFLESIRKYNPDFQQDDGTRVKLCTYAYSRAERLIQEWILTNSRLVRVPRSKMGRILTVVKAYEELEDDDVNLYSLTSMANKIQQNKCVLTDRNTFTVEEVDELIKILMSNYIHLDQPFNRHNKSNPTTIGEMISNDEPCVTELIQAQDHREQLLEILQDNLDEIEFQIISLRYFHDITDKVPKALKEIGPLLVSVYGGSNYSRESIRKIENGALDKLKSLLEIKRLW